MATGGWGKGRAAFWKAGNALSSFCWSQIPHPCLSREAHVTAQAQGGGGAQGEAWPCSGRCGQAGLSLATALNALQATSPPDGPGRHLGLPCHVGGLGQKQRTGGPDTEGAPALAEATVHTSLREGGSCPGLGGGGQRGRLKPGPQAHSRQPHWYVAHSPGAAPHRRHWARLQPPGPPAIIHTPSPSRGWAAELGAEGWAPPRVSIPQTLLQHEMSPRPPVMTLCRQTGESPVLNKVICLCKLIYHILS